ncbi:hypothetical protein [Microbacterium sp. NPDC089695]|uniref:hypothetical protein n=1 Tax=Microbacterium sp. NPDC089695 TaxID=3364198 RepID=UPI0038035B18
MTEEPQPELRWAPLEPKPRNRGRVWLIVGLVAAGIVVIGLLLFFLLPRGAGQAPEQTATPTPTATPTATPTPTPTPEPPVQTEAPPVPDPSVEAFSGQVGPRLQDAGRGLDIVRSAAGPDALPVVDTLQQDLQNVADTPPPSSIAAEWETAMLRYSDDLNAVRSAVESGGDIATAVDSAARSLTALKALIGL